jgi:putative lipoprotein (rSAM/lipoprotein system)
MKKALSFYSKILASLFAFTGMATGCFYSKYGTPFADFQVRGYVYSQETDEPIENIEVVVNSIYESNDTIICGVERGGKTDLTGFYDINMTVIGDSETFRIDYKDIDSTENGYYKDTSIFVTNTHKDYIGGNGEWYNGQVIRNIDIKLAKKQ